MKSKTIRFLSFLFPCLLVCFTSWAQRGPQDTWYETGKVPLPENCNPYDLIVTDEGTLLMSDTENDVIHELEANGSLIRSFGSPGSEDGQFNNPIELAIGPGNRIYVADKNNNRIQILERNGTFVKAFGSNGTENGKLKEPWGLAISTEDEVFVSDKNNHRVQVFDANGSFLRKWGSNGDLDGKMNEPKGIDIDQNFDVYLMDSKNKRISIFSKSGNFLRNIPVQRGNNSSFVWPFFIKIFPNGLIATGGENTNYNQHYLRLRMKDGSLIKTINFDPPFYSKGSPSAMSSNGKLFFANSDKKKLHILRQTYRALRPNPSKDAPMPEVISVTQPAGTNHLEIKYRITDADSVKVKAGLLAFKDGGNDLSKVIVPKTFIGSVEGKLDENTTTGTIHTVTWDAKADWNVSYGNVELAVVAQDDRELMNFHFLTLPATDSNSTPLKISRSPVDNNDFLNAWYTLLALGDENIELKSGSISQKDSNISAPAGFSPANLNGLVAWFDASDIDANGIPDQISDGDSIGIWSDKAGGDHNATASGSPTFSSLGLNDRNAVSFDSNDRFSFAEITNIRTVLWVVQRTPNNDYNFVLGHHSLSDFHPKGNRIWYSSENKWNEATRLNGLLIKGSEESIPTTPYILSMVSTDDASASRISEDRSFGRHWRGLISEILIFSESLSYNQVADIEKYLAEKWGCSYSKFPHFANSTSTTPSGRSYLFNKMNLSQATAEELTRAREAATPGVTNKFTPSFMVGPGERPTKVNEYGFDSDSTSSNHFWVVPKN